MKSNWKKSYDALTEYITRNHDIEITASCVSISSDNRPNFYRLFNAVTTEFVDNFASSLEKGRVLRSKWLNISGEIKDTLGLEAIDLDPGTGWFLADSKDGLARDLFHALFDLLKGRMDLDGFEQMATRLVEAGFDRYFRDGYRLWATLCMLKLLSVDKAYAIPRSDFDMDPNLHPEELKGSRVEEYPDAEEVKRISFAHHKMFSFMLPRVIVKSSRLGVFVALCSDFNLNEARWKARGLSQEQEWYSISDITKKFGRSDLWPDLAFYTGSDPKELVVAADYFQIARPDLIVEFRERPDWNKKEGLGAIKYHYDVLRPRLGSFVVCLDPVPEAALEELRAREENQSGKDVAANLQRDIHLIDAGYDIATLEPVIEILAGVKTKSIDAEINSGR